MNQLFLDYSKYYDLLYKDKNYQSEVNFILEIIKKYNPEAKSILNLGCGTGNHDFLLAKENFNIIGVDISSDMINIASIKNKYKNCQFLVGDATKINLDIKFDIIISLFHVLSYQNTDTEVINFFKTISNHLKPNGIAIFDYWYAPAVLNIKPEDRIKNFESDSLSIERKAKTQMDLNRNLALVNFEISIKDKYSKKDYKICEKHPMRFFYSEEIIKFTNMTTLTLLEESEWMQHTPPNNNSWSAYSIIGRR